MPFTKAELRQNALKRRDGIDGEMRAQFASRLADVGPRLVLDFVPVVEHPVVSFYSAIGSEPDPMPMALRLHDAGFQLVLPVDWSPGTPLVYRAWLPGDPLAVGPLGIGEPLEDAPEWEPDILFMPLAAFDRRGYRIGYGAGNVDRTLAELRGRKRILVVAIAYSIQEELIVPNDPHDHPVDIVVTERDILYCRVAH